jgi:methylenetetrahydrofolate dehydrogenase (NADP+)/methenyltetrahydrofolate cyclohydrolase
LIGDLTPSQIYVRNKEKSANEVGLKSEVIKYPDTVEEKVILDKIEELNKDDLVSGILVQLPLPKHIDKQKVIETITSVTSCRWFSSTECWPLVFWL